MYPAFTFLSGFCCAYPPLADRTLQRSDRRSSVQRSSCIYIHAPLFHSLACKPHPLLTTRIPFINGITAINFSTPRKPVNVNLINMLRLSTKQSTTHP